MLWRREWKPTLILLPEESHGQRSLAGYSPYCRTELGMTEVKWSESCSVMSDSLQLHGLYCPWNSPGQNTRVGSLFLLQGIFPTQGLNPGLPHCRRFPYQRNFQESPRILEWVAYLFSSGSFWPRNRTGVFFTSWAIGVEVEGGAARKVIIACFRVAIKSTKGNIHENI